jgi:hypothetical protein
LVEGPDWANDLFTDPGANGDAPTPRSVLSQSLNEVNDVKAYKNDRATREEYDRLTRVAIRTPEEARAIKRAGQPPSSERNST